MSTGSESTIPGPTSDTIVVGVDTSAESIAALHWAAELAARTGVHLLAVHAEGLLEEGSYVPHVDVAAVITQALHGATAPATMTSLVEPGPPCETLMRVARRSGSRHIVVGHRGAGDTGSDIGSTALLLVSRSTVPVTVVRSDAPS
jgi:nucleotide-binding universal stress UspA family protein